VYVHSSQYWLYNVNCNNNAWICNNVGDSLDWKVIVTVLNGTQTDEWAEHSKSTTSIFILTCSIPIMNIYYFSVLIYFFQANVAIILDRL
jgi:hypothetical protein